MTTDNINTQTKSDAAVLAQNPLFEDIKTSVTIVSLLANLAIFVTWLTVTAA